MFTPEWPKYLELIKKHRPVATSIFNLIYMGCLDEFIVAPQANNLPIYKIMADEIRNTLKSRAKLSKGFKTDDIALCDVKNPIDLIRWRIGYNPISKSNLIDIYQEKLRDLGFRKQPNAMFPYLKERSGKVPACRVVTKLTEFMTKYPGTNGFNSIVCGENTLALFGLVTELRFFRYSGGDKEALKINIYTGDELIELVIWPGKDGAVSPQVTEKIRKNRAGLFQIKLLIKDGKPSYKIGHIAPIDAPYFPLPIDPEPVTITETQIAKDGEAVNSGVPVKKNRGKAKENNN